MRKFNRNFAIMVDFHTLESYNDRIEIFLDLMIVRLLQP